MKLSSLPLKMSVPYRNRTYNRVLGGPRYIHLTTRTLVYYHIQLIYITIYLKKTLVLIHIFYAALHPDIPFETSSHLWLAEQIFLIDADWKFYIITFDIYRINIFFCIRILQ